MSRGASRPQTLSNIRVRYQRIQVARFELFEKKPIEVAFIALFTIEIRVILDRQSEMDAPSSDS
jgi:hypothetical protein